MIDHLLHFTDSAAAFAELAMQPHIVEDDDGPLWNPGYAMENPTATAWDETGQPTAFVPGYLVQVSLPALSPELVAAPNYALRAAFDRDVSAAQERNVAIYLAPDLTPEALQYFPINMYAGSPYSRDRETVYIPPA